MPTPNWSLFIQYVKPHRWQMLGLWLLLLSTIAVQLINPQIIRHFLDAAQMGRPLSVLLGAAGLFFAIALAEQGLALLGTYLSTNVSWQATNRLREVVALHCLQLDLGFHKEHSPGEMIERIDGDINALGNFFSHLMLNLLTNLLLLTGILVLLWREDWRVGGASTLIALCGLLAVNAIRRAAVPHWQQVRQATADLYGFLEERLGGVEDIRANGAVAYVMQRLAARFQALYQVSYRPSLLNVAGLVVPILTFGLAYSALFLLGDFLYRRQGMTIGTVYLIFYYVGLLNGPLWQIVNEVRDLQVAGASIGRVQELLQTSSRILDQGRQSLPDGALAVEFAGVAFSYAPEEDMVLQDINFRLAPGELLGLVGRTGSGKTTLTRLLMRLLDPTQGSIRLGTDSGNRVDLRDLSLHALRGRVSMVTQEVQLLHGTLRDNLTFYDESISDAQLHKVIDDLGLERWLDHLPQGLDSSFTSGGGGLSSGEAQLIAFMRVMLQDPGLLLLDEPSSHLDPVTERLLDRAIARVLQDRTGIIIAHRLQTVQRTDKILILEQGRIVEFGERATLEQDVAARFHALLQSAEPPEPGNGP